MIAYLQTHFKDDIVTELFWQWKKGGKLHENNAKLDFDKKEESYIENSTE